MSGAGNRFRKKKRNQRLFKRLILYYNVSCGLASDQPAKCLQKQTALHQGTALMTVERLLTRRPGPAPSGQGGPSAAFPFPSPVTCRWAEGTDVCRASIIALHYTGQGKALSRKQKGKISPIYFTRNWRYCTMLLPFHPAKGRATPAPFSKALLRQREFHAGTLNHPPKSRYPSHHEHQKNGQKVGQYRPLEDPETGRDGEKGWLHRRRENRQKQRMEKVDS